jgi:hypothetical protein
VRQTLNRQKAWRIEVESLVASKGRERPPSTKPALDHPCANDFARFQCLQGLQLKSSGWRGTPAQQRLRLRTSETSRSGQRRASLVAVGTPARRPDTRVRTTTPLLGDVPTYSPRCRLQPAGFAFPVLSAVTRRLRTFAMSCHDLRQRANGRLDPAALMRVAADQSVRSRGRSGRASVSSRIPALPAASINFPPGSIVQQCGDVKPTSDGGANRAPK